MHRIKSRRGKALQTCIPGSSGMRCARVNGRESKRGNISGRWSVREGGWNFVKAWERIGHSRNGPIIISLLFLRVLIVFLIPSFESLGYRLGLPY